MLPTYVALVPYEDGSRLEADELLWVAAALQTQVVRDLSPIWEVSAVVSPFLSLEDVPSGYLPIAIVDAELPRDEHGFHLAIGGPPFAVVQYRAGWSLGASHELIEMLCDASGERTMSAPSLRPTQGQVEYFLEVCDPCELSTYVINDVVVSDFVTPQYYSALDHECGCSSLGRDCVCYSFTGRVTGPLTLLAGGYVSWSTGLRDSSVWQAHAPAGDSDMSGDPKVVPVKDLVIDRLSNVPPASSAESPSRKWLDLERSRPVVTAGGRSHSPYYSADESAQAYGKMLRKNIGNVLEWLASDQPPPTLDDIIPLLQKLAADDNFRQNFSENPGDELAAHNIKKNFGIEPPRDMLPPKQVYQGILDALKEQRKLFGPTLGDPRLAFWMCWLIGI